MEYSGKIVHQAVLMRLVEQKIFPEKFLTSHGIDQMLLECLVGGFLPFSAISVELYYIFSTFWGREQYMLYGILTIVFHDTSLCNGMYINSIDLFSIGCRRLSMVVAINY